MGTIANAKVTHYYNCYNGDFIGCLLQSNGLQEFLFNILPLYSQGTLPIVSVIL